MNNFYVIEGEHVDPNDKKSLIESSKKIHGPYNEEEASKMPLIVIDKTEITGPNTLYDGIADSFNPSGHPISKMPATIR